MFFLIIRIKSMSVVQNSTRKVICETRRGQEEETQDLKKISIIRPSLKYLPYPPRKKEEKRCLERVWRGMKGWGDEAIGSCRLEGLFEDYEDVYIQSWRPAALSSGLWRRLDRLCIPVKKDGQVEFTNWDKWAEKSV